MGLLMGRWVMPSTAPFRGCLPGGTDANKLSLTIALGPSLALDGSKINAKKLSSPCRGRYYLWHPTPDELGCLRLGISFVLPILLSAR